MVKPDRAGDRRDDGVCLGDHGRLDERVLAAPDLDVRICKGDAQLLRGRLVRDGDHGGMQAARLLLRKLDAAVGGDGPHTQAEMLRHGDGLTADTAGGAENRDRSYHSVCLFGVSIKNS